LAQAAGQEAYEFQRLHGMGETLYATARDLFGDMNVRVYAPVGAHEDLLPYLVRRLLENGANTSFVHAFLDEDVPVERVAGDPLTALEAGTRRHLKLPAPPALYGDARTNSKGLYLTLASDVLALEQAIAAQAQKSEGQGSVAITSPQNHRVTVGHIEETSLEALDAACAKAHTAQPAWDRLGGYARSLILARAASALWRWPRQLQGPRFNPCP
jgi:RHH-type proline utilization regulon transcriptional repressor/proline dehydrogenase/delta 1-pyrroline-5-carboxylate dehydrogenase